MTAVMATLGVVLFGLGLLASIGLHEIGHLVPAKRFGVRVTQYMIGFGPTLWSRRRGETEYGVKAIPLGGYIRMVGMYPPAPGDRPDQLRRASTGPFQSLIEDARSSTREEMQPGDDNRVFYRKPISQRLVIMLGGPTMNLVIAVVLLVVALCVIGAPAYRTDSTVAQVSACVVPANRAGDTCAPGDPAAPAVAAGIRSGDRIISVGGTAVSTWEQASAAIRDAGGRMVTIGIERDGRARDLTVRLATTKRPVSADDPTLVTVGFLGVQPTAPTLVGSTRAPLSAVPGLVGTGIGQVVGLVVNLPQRMVGVWQAATGGERDINGPIGVVGAGRIGGEIAAQPDPLWVKGVGLIGLLASINLALFVINLVPLLPFDGGHVAGALWEGVRRAVARVRRRPDPGFVDIAKLLPLTYAVALLLVGMSALLLYADIVNPVRLG